MPFPPGRSCDVEHTRVMSSWRSASLADAGRCGSSCPRASCLDLVPLIANNGCQDPLFAGSWAVRCSLAGRRPPLPRLPRPAPRSSTRAPARACTWSAQSSREASCAASCSCGRGRGMSASLLQAGRAAACHGERAATKWPESRRPPISRPTERQRCWAAPPLRLHWSHLQVCPYLFDLLLTLAHTTGPRCARRCRHRECQVASWPAT